MKCFFIFTFLCFQLLAYTQKGKPIDKFVISGKLIGQDTGIIVLSYSNLNRKFIHDTTFLKKGFFRFSGFINEPTNAYIDGNIKSKSVNDLNTTDFFLEPKEIKLTITVNDFKHASIAGSHTQDEIEILNKQKEIFYNTMDIKRLEIEYSDIIDRLRKDKENKALKEESKLVFNKLNPYREIIKTIDYQFITTHSKSYLSPYLLRYYFAFISLDSLNMFYNQFSFAIQNSNFGNTIREQIIKKSGVGIGSQAKDFSTKDIYGNIVSLSSFNGNAYVLLDFWASWCVPCRHGNPNLIALYNKYHSKNFDIISVSSDNDKSDWLKAITIDSIEMWHHILSGFDSKKFDKGELNENDINVKYVIGVLPTKILIDKNGIIIFRSEGDDDDLLNKKLAEIFK